MWGILLALPLAYILSRLLNRSLEEKLEAMKLVYKGEIARHHKTKVRYEERISMMNTAFEQFRKGNG